MSSRSAIIVLCAITFSGAVIAGLVFPLSAHANQIGIEVHEPNSGDGSGSIYWREGRQDSDNPKVHICKIENGSIAYGECFASHGWSIFFGGTSHMTIYANPDPGSEFVGWDAEDPDVWARWSGFGAQCDPYAPVAGEAWCEVSCNYTLGCPGNGLYEVRPIFRGGNSPPNPPTITGDGGETDEELPFSFRATDPDGDRIVYQIIWDGSFAVDEWLPACTAGICYPWTINYVSSGATLTSTHSWSTAGNKTIVARTLDDRGATSGWTFHTVSITAPTGQTILNVRSEPEGGATISGDSGSGGVTNYTHTSDSDILDVLTAEPELNGGEFERWGGCSSSPLSGRYCYVNIPEGGTQTVTAYYDTAPEDPPPPPAPVEHDLSVSVVGDGSDAVTGDPGNVNCSSSSTCVYTYDEGTTVSLTANASEGSEFSHWSGACSGPNTGCSVTMDRAKSVTAHFGLLPPVISDFDADPTWVRYNGGTALSWEVSNADSCTLSDGSTTIDPVGTSESSYSRGGFTTGITEVTEYTLTCENDAGSVSDSEIVYVLPIYEEF